MAVIPKQPGQLVVLGDGTECRMVQGDRVPARFWKTRREQDGYEHISMRIVSTWKGGWCHYERVPYCISDGGALYSFGLEDDFKDDTGISEPAHVLVCLPLDFCEPEVNEFGEVSP